ncbi:hypothetical protein JTE90_013248 [Oedothorax gibbosus]|uniref:tRNA (guanine-N(7)-)-methyltransferase non-catalytic subunit n=1 Tax=Oedothorax gibbosus TaxID=931172 RepID=A0AAV6VF03_9ARAC|nr:hypothetical protein JTE90_013248 [Oedothorax gibbosus]
MAFYTNAKNVGASLFLKNDEIFVFSEDSATNPNTVDPIKLKCKLSVIVQTSDDAGKKSKKQTKETETPTNFITSAIVSNCSTYIAAGDANNSLHLWKKENKEWKITSVRSVVRKCQKIIFTNSASDIIVADRGGDVFTFSVSKSNDPASFLLGHISLILDMSISSDDKYLATCDRDGKIRVSHYPNSYNILSYCLGHQEFVSSLQFLPLYDGEVLVSSSGDGTMKMWNFTDGSSKESVSFHENDSLCRDCNVKVEGQSEILSDNLALSEKQVMFSVRSVKYNQKYRLVIVLFHLQCCVAVYRLCDGELKSFVFKQLIPLTTPPLDAMFTDNGNLYVLTKKKGNALVYFKYHETSEAISKAEDSELSSLKDVQEFYKDHEQIPFQDDFVSLFKRVYDVPDDDECGESKGKKNKVE